MLNNMSFREKSTWISFLLLLLIAVPFFYQFVRIESGASSSQASFHLFLLLVIVFVVGEVVLQPSSSCSCPGMPVRRRTSASA